MRLLERMQIDLLRDELGWDVHEELDYIIDCLWDAQQSNVHPDLSELKAFKDVFLELWDEYQFLKSITPENPFLQKNEQVLLLIMMNLWTAAMTIEGFDLHS